MIFGQEGQGLATKPNRLAERLSATASRLSIGIANLEPLARQSVVEMNFGTTEIGQTIGIDGESNSVRLLQIVTIFKFVEAHSVLETGTSAWFDENTQHFGSIPCFDSHFANSNCSLVG